MLIFLISFILNKMDSDLTIDASIELIIDDNPIVYQLLSGDTFPIPLSCDGFDLSAVSCETVLCFINSFGVGDAGQGAFDVVFDAVGVKVRHSCALSIHLGLGMRDRGHLM